MSMQSRARILCASFVMVWAVAVPAHADLSIAKAPTSNVSCSKGSCAATAPSAVLNVDKLQHLLAREPLVSVNAGVASNITVDAALSWTSNATLHFTAAGALTVNRPVTVAGSGSVAIQTADHGLSFAPKASLSFWDITSGLTINTVPYTLVNDIKSLGFDVSTAVAFARDYDASADGDYPSSPVAFLDTPGGRLDGLGHTLSHLSVNGTGDDGSGFIGESWGTVTNLHLAQGKQFCGANATGVAVGKNYGLIDHVSVSGAILGESWCGTEAGGLTGENELSGIIRNSSAKIRIPRGGWHTGGLTGINAGTISNSWTDGTVRGMGTPAGAQGGLVGLNVGTVANSYSVADTRFCAQCRYDAAHGGLIAETSTSPDYPSKIISSYAAGRTAPPSGPWRWTSACDSVVNLAGAVVGCDGTDSFFASTYWVTDRSRHNPKNAAGNKPQLAGVTGLTQAQLKSGLPAGFDPQIWGQSPTVNQGYPYLLANPPQ